MSVPQVPWSQAAAEVTSGLGVDPAVGLDSGQVAQRLRRDGPNRLPGVKPRSLLAILWAQLRSLLVGLLALAAGIGFLFGDTVEAYAILAVIALNTAIGFFSELRAVRSMEALRRLGVTTCRVRRDGALRELPAEALVVGDVVLLEGGDLVPADLRVLDSARLQVDESALTGESLPVAKHADPVPPGAPLAERACMLYRGTAVSAGTVLGVVTATGLATELGMISRLVAQAKPQATPLEKRLDRLGQRLAGLALVIAAAIAATGLAADRDLMLMVMTGIALAVAALPEGLPVVATLSLARGMHRMARRNALINRLAAVETLGATSVICTDKTGTLTENRLTVTHLVLPGTGPLEVPADAVPASLADARDRLLHAGRLCNNAALHGDGGVGDPLEVALLQAARGIALADPGAPARGALRSGAAPDGHRARRARWLPDRGQGRAGGGIGALRGGGRRQRLAATAHRSAAPSSGWPPTRRWPGAGCACWRWRSGATIRCPQIHMSIWSCWAWSDSWTRRAMTCLRQSINAARPASGW